jgi:hypothetical protein
MEWLLLLLVIPLIVGPVVLLWGFAGCTPFETDEGIVVPAAPFNLNATATGTDGIKLGWQVISATAKFWVERLDGLTWNQISPPQDLSFLPGAPFEFTDTNPFRGDGDDRTYRIRARVAGVSSAPSAEAKATTIPNAPTNLVATPEDVNKIVLKWDHVTKSNKDIKFKITHTLKTPPGTSEKFTIQAKDLAPPNTYSHTVAEGSAHEYQIAAVVDGFETSAPPFVESKEIESASSGIKSAKPLAFKADLNEDQAGLEGYCLVQRISNFLLKNSGTIKQITLHGSTVGNLKLDRIFLWQVAPGASFFATAAAHQQVASNLTLPMLPAGNVPPPIVPTTSFTLDKAKDLLIAFDISASAGQGNVRAIGTTLDPFTGAPHYFKTASQLQSEPNGTGFTKSTFDRLYLVEKIEVS